MTCCGRWSPSSAMLGQGPMFSDFWGSIYHPPADTLLAVWLNY